MIDLVIAQPWWVVSLMILGAALASTYVLVTGVRALVSTEEITVRLPDGYITAEQSKELLSIVKSVKSLEVDANQMLRMHDNLGARIDIFEERLGASLQECKYSSENAAASLSVLQDHQQLLLKSIQDLSALLKSHQSTEEDRQR